LCLRVNHARMLASRARDPTAMRHASLYPACGRVRRPRLRPSDRHAPTSRRLDAEPLASGHQRSETPHAFEAAKADARAATADTRTTVYAYALRTALRTRVFSSRPPGGAACRESEVARSRRSDRHRRVSTAVRPATSPACEQRVMGSTLSTRHAWLPFGSRVGPASSPRPPRGSCRAVAPSGGGPQSGFARGGTSPRPPTHAAGWA